MGGLGRGEAGGSNEVLWVRNGWVGGWVGGWEKRDLHDSKEEREGGGREKGGVGLAIARHTVGIDEFLLEWVGGWVVELIELG